MTISTPPRNPLRVQIIDVIVPRGQGGRLRDHSSGDALYEEFFREPDLDAQAELGNQIDALLWEDPYTIPLYQQPVFLAYTAVLEG